MTAEIIPFPNQRRVTTAGRSYAPAVVQQVIDRAHEERDRNERYRQVLGFGVDDTVTHNTYGWQGVVAAIDIHNGQIHAMVEKPVNGRCTTVAVPVSLLRKAVKQ